MSNYRVINAYIPGGRQNPGKLDVVTTAGERLTLSSKTKISAFPMEASGDEGLHRIMLDDNDIVTMSCSAKELWERTKQNTLGLTTIYKYYDDSGCVSKSRDDGYLSEV